MASAPVPETDWYVSTTTRSRPTASRSAIRTGTSCIVEQFGLAMIPSWPSRSSGLTCDTTSGIAGSIRQADELSITVAPRATAAGASSRDTSAPAEKQRDVDAVERVRDGLADLERAPIDRDGPAGRPPGGEQAQLIDRELPLVEDLDHRPSDGAGGADDGDGEGLTVHQGHGSARSVARTGTAGV